MSGIETGPADYYVFGEFNFACDICAKKYKSSQAYFCWDKTIRCWQCFEYRNPLDFAKGIPDKPTPPWTRPRPPPIWLAGSDPDPAQVQSGSLLVNAQLVGAPLLG